jgi:hypothetical protein
LVPPYLLLFQTVFELQDLLAGGLALLLHAESLLLLNFLYERILAPVESFDLIQQTLQSQLGVTVLRLYVLQAVDRTPQLKIQGLGLADFLSLFSQLLFDLLDLVAAGFQPVQKRLLLGEVT